MTPRRLLAGVGCLFFLLPVLGTWTTGGVPWSLRALSAAILVLTAVQPRWGLVAVATLLPLDALVAVVTQPEVGGQALPEIVLAPFLLAAAARAVTDAPRPAGRLAGPALVLGTIVGVSGLLSLAARQQTTMWLSDYLRGFWTHLASAYYEETSAFDAFHAATVWIEGLTLAAFAEQLLRGRLSAPSRILVGLSAAAVHAWVRLAQISLRREQPIAAAIGFLQTQRINTLYSDANAAGSLFALFLVPAVWMAIARARFDQPLGGLWRRLPWGYILTSIAIALALWMTHSRAAYAGAVIGLAGVWMVSRRTGRVAILTASAAAVLLIGAVLLNRGTASQSSSAVSVGVRWDMAKIALQIAEEHPAFGVGLHEFRIASRAFVTADLRERFPATASGENAHNNFLQILAELGITGLAAFLWLLAAAFGSLRGGTGSGGRPEQLALAGGVAAFLVSCLGGHPFLTTEVLWLFLLVLGATAGLGDRVVSAFGRTAPGPAEAGYHVPHDAGARSRHVAIVLAALVIGSMPVRLWQLRHDDARRTVIGAGPLTDAGADRVYRRAGARSLWTVPSRARTVQIPLRATPDSRLPCLVHIDVDGRPANVVEVSASGWTPAIIQLEPKAQGTPARPVELRLDGSHCRLMVGMFDIH